MEDLMRISPGYVHSKPINQNSSLANEAKKIDSYANAIDNKNLHSKLVSKKELLDLSNSLKNGQITKNDARRYFIDFVSRKSLEDKISAKDMALTSLKMLS
jgi:hypothetical protein